jgi:hypothetical protein
VTRDPQDKLARAKAGRSEARRPQPNPNGALVPHRRDGAASSRAKTRASAVVSPAPGIVAAMLYDDWVASGRCVSSGEDDHRQRASLARLLTESRALPRVRVVSRADLHRHRPRGVGAASKLWIEMDKAAQTALVRRHRRQDTAPKVLAELIAAGRIKVCGGTAAEVESFFALFDRPGIQPVRRGKVWK